MTDGYELSHGAHSHGSHGDELTRGGGYELTDGDEFAHGGVLSPSRVLLSPSPVRGFVRCSKVLCSY